MKKSIVLALAVAFLAATSGLVWAQDTAGSAPPKTHKTHKSKTHKHKKSKAASTAPSGTTSAAPAPSGDSGASATK